MLVFIFEKPQFELNARLDLNICMLLLRNVLLPSKYQIDIHSKKNVCGVVCFLPFYCCYFTVNESNAEAAFILRLIEIDSFIWFDFMV